MRIIASGGIGNQMFQYAVYIALKNKRKQVKFDISLYNFMQMHNGFELNSVFYIDENFYSNDSKFYKFLLRVINKFKFRYFVFVDNGGFTNKIFSSGAFFFLGYWQSEKYFKNIELDIRKVFEFKNVNEENLNFSKIIRDCNSVSIHIRLGDYVGLESVKGICTKKYYENAIDYVNNHTDNPIYFVFSNDISQTKSMFKSREESFIYVDLNVKDNSNLDMFLMSNCRHNIIANSSFSWWAAWLNSNEKKIVITPEKWVNDNVNKNKHIIPKQWIKIQNY